RVRTGDSLSQAARGFVIGLPTESAGRAARVPPRPRRGPPALAADGAGLRRRRAPAGPAAGAPAPRPPARARLRPGAGTGQTARPRAAPAAAARRTAAHVALVDDVMTTGATLHAAATALRRAGVARVDAWVCARVP